VEEDEDAEEAKEAEGADRNLTTTEVTMIRGSVSRRKRKILPKPYYEADYGALRANTKVGQVEDSSECIY